MSFDQKDGVPLVNVHKRTTKVNLWMIGAVLLFLAFGVAALVAVNRTS